MTPTIRTYKLRPQKFIEDCLESECDIGAYDFKTGVLSATWQQVAELRSRAEHYANGGVENDGNLPIIYAARALLAALRKLYTAVGA